MIARKKKKELTAVVVMGAHVTVTIVVKTQPATQASVSVVVTGLKLTVVGAERVYGGRTTTHGGTQVTVGDGCCQISGSM
jgi:hypothetical protein